MHHVTASPSNNVIQRCAENIRLGKHPFLLVPRTYEERARAFAEVADIDQQLTIVSIEAFSALNVVEVATEENTDFFAALQEIIDIYNRRLTEVEPDLSLQIEVH